MLLSMLKRELETWGQAYRGPLHGPLLHMHARGDTGIYSRTLAFSWKPLASLPRTTAVLYFILSSGRIKESLWPVRGLLADGHPRLSYESPEAEPS